MLSLDALEARVLTEDRRIDCNVNSAHGGSGGGTWPRSMKPGTSESTQHLYLERRNFRGPLRCDGVPVS